MRVLSYPEPLLSAFFIKRYKRFLCDVSVPVMDNTEIIVHCANSGSMKSCLAVGAQALIMDSHNPSRKLRYSLESLQLEDGWACLNTQRANQVVGLLMDARNALSSHAAFPGSDLFLKDFGTGAFHPEHRYDAKSRLDGLVTTADGKRHWIEIKSVSLRLAPDRLAFPDAVTTRGQKHLGVLADIAKGRAPGANGPERATVIYAIMRGSALDAAELAQSFAPAEDIDPGYAQAARAAAGAGVATRILVVGAGPEGLDVRGYYAPESS
jgi:sugar fermentation stimulation protein A